MSARFVTLPVLFVSLLAADSWGQSVNIPRPVSGLSAINFDPAVSRNGRYVAFASDEGGDDDIWLVDLNTGSRRRLTSISSSEYSPCFAGNDRIYFVSTRDNARGEIFEMGTGGGKMVKLQGGRGYFDSPAVSPDGRLLAYVHGEDGDPPKIFFLNLKSMETKQGPLGFDPSFSPDGRAIVFIGYKRGDSGTRSLAVYRLENDSTEFFDTGTGLAASPCYFPDGDLVVFERHIADSDGDGKITFSDRPTLSVISLREGGKTRPLYPGYDFGRPAIGVNGELFVVSNDNNILSISSAGIVSAGSDASSQSALCDSLIRSISSRSDSLEAAAVCWRSFDHYPDSLADYFWNAIELYRALNMTRLALSLLDGIDRNADSRFRIKSAVTAAIMKFYDGEPGSREEAWNVTENEIRSIIGADDVSSAGNQDAYLSMIAAAHDVALIEKSNALLVEALLLFTGDDDFISQLELWRLRNIAAGFKGDLADIAPLYIDYLDRFVDRPELAATVIRDLIGFTRGLGDDVAIASLENLRTLYPDYPSLCAGLSLEEGKRFEHSGKTDFAAWKYIEAINECDDCPAVKFEALEKRADIAFSENDLAGAANLYDSAAGYVNEMKSPAAASRLERKRGKLLTASGYEILRQDPRAAARSFSRAISMNQDDHYAIWGWASALSAFGDDGDWRSAESEFGIPGRREYFQALRGIIEYGSGGRKSSIGAARKLLERSIELDYSFPLPYLSLGYVYCLLERMAKESSGTYEKAVEVSGTGLALANDNRYLMAAFHLNLGEAYFGLGQFKSAYENFILAAAMDSTVVLENAADVYSSELGESGFQIDSLEMALDRYSKLYRDALQGGDLSRQAALASKIGIIHQLSGDYVEAIEYFRTALPYYLSRRNNLKAANLFKASAICFDRYGNYTEAAKSAREAVELLRRSGRRGRLFEDRLKIEFIPLGLDIPIISLGPIIYGNSVYPYGFPASADLALLTSLSSPGKDRVDIDRELISILEKGGESKSTIGIYNRLGLEYYRIGYADSAVYSFLLACEKAGKKELYGLALNCLLNGAAAVFSDSSLTADLRMIDRLSGMTSALLEKTLPTDLNTMASLRNILGICETIKALNGAWRPEAEELKDPANFISDLQREAKETTAILENARRYFREGVSEVAFAENASLLATLSLNEAAVSFLLGDFDAYRTAMERASREAPFSGSEAVNLRTEALRAISGDDPRSPDAADGIVGSFESMSSEGNLALDKNLIETVLARAIEDAWRSADTMGTLLYCERARKLRLTAIRGLISAEIYGDDLQKARTRQIRKLQAELRKLSARERAAIAMGTAGQVELKRLREERLSIRSRLLSLKEKSSEQNPFLMPLLFAEKPYLKYVLENLRTGEVFLCAERTNDPALLWFVDTRGVSAYAADIEGEKLRLVIEKELRGGESVTLIGDNRSCRRLGALIREVRANIVVKRAYSLESATGIVGDTPVMLAGQAVAGFVNPILRDTARVAALGGFIEASKLFQPENRMKFGWIVLDGRLNFDRNNPLMSYWEVDDASIEDGGQPWLHVYEFPGKSLGAFGAIVTGFPIDEDPAAKWAVVDALRAAGFRAVILLDDSTELKAREDFIYEFFESQNLRRPSDAFVMAGNAISRPSETAIRAEYYGEDGFDGGQRADVMGEWFRRSEAAGDSCASAGHWAGARENLLVARKLADAAGISDERADEIARKMIEIMIKTGDNDQALEAQTILIENASDDPDLQIYRWQEYREIAREAGRIELSSQSSWKILEIAVAIGDRSMEAETYLHLAEDFIATGNLDSAEEYARTSISKSESAGDSVLMAEAMYTLAKAEISAGDGAAAIGHLTLAGELFESADSDYWRYETLKTLGVLYISRKEHSRGREALIAALRHYEFMHDDQAARECRYNLALSYLETDEVARAENLVNDMLSESRIDAKIFIISSRVELRRGRLEDSYSRAVQALSAAEKGDHADKSAALENLGDLLYAQGDFQKAAEQYRLAVELAGYDSAGNVNPILLIKSATAPNIDFGAADSILIVTASDSIDMAASELAEYHLAAIKLEKGDNEKARESLRSILNSGNYGFASLLKWRSAYALAGLAKGGERGRYLALADSLYRLYPPEPAYLQDEYHLQNSPDEIYSALADEAFENGSPESAIDFFERMIAVRTQSQYISFGYSNEADSELAGSASRPPADSERVSSESDPFSAVSAETCRRNLGPTQCVIRFYQLPGKLVSFYIDSDTIAYNITGINMEEMNENVLELKNSLIGTADTDSILEKWYEYLFGPFERLLEEAEQVLVVPDGPSVSIPFKALKIPDADYLGETYDLAFSLFLPREFPADIAGRLSPCFADEGISQSVGIVNRVVEVLGGCSESGDNAVRFSVGFDDFREREREGTLFCDLQPAEMRADRIRLESLRAARTGYRGLISTLWGIPDQALSYYYWTFFNELSSGRGVNASRDAASAYLFGRYKGAPYYWGFNVLFCLY